MQLRQLQSLIKQTVSKGAQTSTCLLVRLQHRLTFDPDTSDCCVARYFNTVCVCVCPDHPPVPGPHHHAQLQPVQT